MVDVHLKSAPLHIARKAISSADNTRKDEERWHMFLQALRDCVLDRTQKIVPTAGQRGPCDVIGGKQLIRDGGGGLEIHDPPTPAQEQLIRNLVKVVVHQMSRKLSAVPDKSTDFYINQNLLISLFINRVTVEHVPYVEHELASTTNLHQDVALILDAQLELKQSAKPEIQSKPPANVHFEISLYCTTEDINSLPSEATKTIMVSEEFDKIDLNDHEYSNESSDEAEGSTLLSINSSIAALPVSKQTLSQCNITLLPSNNFENYWETLFFDDDIKQKMYSYATVALKISQFTSGKGCNGTFNDCNAISNTNNKLLLVHGPPGTGKTTVCKGLCEKLSIRKEFSNENDPLDLNNKGILVEVNCSRIFSRWFGESSKNLTSIFHDVERLLQLNQESNSFVCLLIDEVEAIASSRTDLLNKNESSDGVRVVNTLLTQLDKLKNYSNFLVVATSNLLDALDPAFIDRADGVFYIGNPSLNGISHILSSSIQEFLNMGIVVCSNDPDTILESQDYRNVMKIIAEKCKVCVRNY